MVGKKKKRDTNIVTSSSSDIISIQHPHVKTEAHLHKNTHTNSTNVTSLISTKLISVKSHFQKHTDNTAKHALTPLYDETSKQQKRDYM